jgi:hypothetical protein
MMNAKLAPAEAESFLRLWSHFDAFVNERASVLPTGVLRVLLARHPELESDGPLGWAPDFPTEHAHHVVAELISACPRDERAAVRDRLLDRLDGLVPDWIDLVRAAADRACKGL